MEGTTWEQRLQSLTHIITHQTTIPGLHSQLFISSKIPCYLNWDYPPLLCNNNNNNVLNKWSFFNLYLKRLSRWCLPETSWRSKCPFQQPPPLVVADRVAVPQQWGSEERRRWVRMRMRRKRLGLEVPAVFAICLPNLLLFSFFLLEPLTLPKG